MDRVQEPVNRIQRRVIAATMPHRLHIASSQIALEKVEAPGIQFCSVHQGMSAPIANAWLSPRAKIAKITSGVGSTQYTIAKSSVANNDPSLIVSPKATAISVTQISIQARLNRKRGSAKIERRDWLSVVVSGFAMVHPSVPTTVQVVADDHTIAAKRAARRPGCTPN
jgi:hypothetical protein